MLLVVATSAIASETLFEDEFSSTEPLNSHWTGYYVNGQNSGTTLNGNILEDIYSENTADSYDSYYMVTRNNATAITSINTINKHDINLSYIRRAAAVDNNPLAEGKIIVEWHTGAGNWNILEESTPSTEWTETSFLLPAGAEDKSELQIRFRLESSNSSDYALWDNILVTYEDTTPPTVEYTGADNMVLKDSQSPILCANVTDDTGIDEVRFIWDNSVNSGITSTKDVPTSDAPGVTNNSPGEYCIETDYIITPKSDNMVVTFSFEATDVSTSENVGTSGTVPFSYTYDTKAPIANAGEPYPCKPGETITLIGSGSNDTVDNNLTYAWNLDTDNQYDDSTLVNPEFTCPVDAVYNTEYTVSLKVTDDVQWSNINTTTVTVSDAIAPTIITSGKSGTVATDSQSTVCATVVDNESGVSQVKFNWWMNDNTSGKIGMSKVNIPGNSVSNTYCTSNQNPISSLLNAVDGMVVNFNIEATDKGNNIANSDNFNFTYDGAAPTANAGDPYTCQPGNNVTFDASASTDSVDSELSYTWTVYGGDVEGGDYSLSGVNPVYTCSTEAVEGNNYGVSLIVYDSVYHISEEVNTTITVNNAPIVEAGEDQTADEGTEITITPSFTDFVDDTHNATVDWGDETTSTLETVDELFSVNHTYADNGIYAVMVTVTDNHGTASSDTLTITVNNVAPVVSITQSFAVVGEEVCLTAEAADVDSLVYSWDLDNDGVEDATTAQACTTWNARGENAVSVTVTDSDEDSTTVTKNITVYDYGISLTAGMNIMSIPLIAENSSIVAVLNNIKDKVEVVWAYQYNEATGEFEWSYYIPSTGVGNLAEMEPGYGYFVKMSEADTLYNNGEKYSVVNENNIPPQVTLGPGWNLIGHYGMNSVNKSDELASVTYGGNVSLANNTMQNIDGTSTLENTTTINPGDAYWVEITEESSQTYGPSNKDYDDPSSGDSGSGSGGAGAGGGGGSSGPIAQ